MPQVVSDIVDVYVFRRLNARVQFLLLQRKPDVALGQTWQSFHVQLERNETTIEAAYRAVEELAGLRVSAVYSADYVNQFYDDSRDTLVLAPVLAVNVSPQAPVRLDSSLRDCAWLDRDEATVRLPFSGQRWAVRHIDEIMSIGHVEAELYRLTVAEPPPPGDGLATSEVGDNTSAPDHSSATGDGNAWPNSTPEGSMETDTVDSDHPEAAEEEAGTSEQPLESETSKSSTRTDVPPASD